VTNSGPDPCELDGYPKYTFLGPSGAGGAGAGAAVAVRVSDAGPAPTPVTLAPGSAADALIVYTDIATGGVTCPAIASALMTPPQSSESLSFPISFAPCGALAIYAFGVPGSEQP
jgi:hypothetical protein